MNQDLIKKLLGLASEPESVELKILHNAAILNAKAYKGESTAAKLKDWQKAKEALQELAASLAAKYGLGEDTDPPKPPAAPVVMAPFEKTNNAAEVLRWLKASGYQTGKTKFYQDIADGRLALDRGFYTAARVKKYADLLPREATGKTDSDLQADIAKEKAEEELEKLRIANRIARRKDAEDMGKLLPRENFYRELAARLVLLDKGVNRLAQSRSEEFVHLVRGDLKKTDELSAALISAFRDLLNEFANTKKFQVMIMPGEKGGVK